MDAADPRIDYLSGADCSWHDLVHGSVNKGNPSGLMTRGILIFISARLAKQKFFEQWRKLTIFAPERFEVTALPHHLSCQGFQKVAESFY